MRPTQFMTLGAALVGGAAIIALSPAVHAGPTPAARPSAQPVVIELFQSQGCSSCPPALAVLEQEAHRPDVIALNFAVTYWDQLGWKDGFAKPEFTRRQYDYSAAGGRTGVSTPQLIVGGRNAIVGGNKAEVDATIAAARQVGGPSLTSDGKTIVVGPAPVSGTASVWLAEYDPRNIAVPIRAGENGGRTLGHRNIVTALSRLGGWSGKPAAFTLPARRAGKAYAVLVQRGTAGPIVAARRL